tara:strand:- start:31 stop:228 length:198 start_codon:yes stop_codon:yes gene_type:complete
MNISNKNNIGNKKMSLTKDFESNDIILSEKNSSKDIEELINLKETHGTEAYYSKRYGWTLRKVIS